MSERKSWTLQEDQILRNLYQNERIRQWTKIAKIMEAIYHIKERNAKQCRQRYHNHLKDGIKKEKWTNEEEQLLINLHAKHGNRWALISRFIEGRSENCVKNMLYAKMRRHVGELNKFIKKHFKRSLKTISVFFVNKLIEITEGAYKKGQNERNGEQTRAIDIKNQILRIGDHHDENWKKEIMISIVQQITLFKQSATLQSKINMSKMKKLKLKSMQPIFTIKDQQSAQEEGLADFSQQCRRRRSQITLSNANQTEITDRISEIKETNSNLVSQVRRDVSCQINNDDYGQIDSKIQQNCSDSCFQSLVEKDELDRLSQFASCLQSFNLISQQMVDSTKDSWGLTDPGASHHIIFN